MKKRPFWLAAWLSVCSLNLWAQTLTDTGYLPQNVTYDSKIPTPESVLGFPVGSWHARPDQIVSYMRALAAASDRVQMQTIGYTYEHRPLVMMTFSSSANLSKLPAIRQTHQQQYSTGKLAAKADPLVLWMGYSVHGNESSGANAALLVAYYLAAAQSEEVQNLLANSVIIMEPAINPDGLGRFATWANMHKGVTANGDPNQRDHNEGWPNGRTNHYWFDLNRDWLLLTHPESQARISWYQQWHPHILTDFHEMGSHSTFFFQPGIPERKNPWISMDNVRMTNLLGQFHADALDQQGKLYFSQQGYDDFYLGKGSSYPDVQGTIGILFEQASSRGHQFDGDNGVLTFADTIQNQVTTSLSTFKAAMTNKRAFQQYQADFVSNTAKLAQQSEFSGYVVKASADPERNQGFLDILRQHHIDVWRLSEDVQKDQQNFKHGQDWFIPLNQPQYLLIRSLFSTRTSFDENMFYDVSSWNIAMAFNLNFSPLSVKEGRKLKAEPVRADEWRQPAWPDNAYAYAFDWQSGRAPALLQALLNAGVKAKVSDASFTVRTTEGEREFSAGSVIVPSGLVQPQGWLQRLKQSAERQQISVYALTTGWTKVGNDVGSASMPVLHAPKVMMLVGPGVSPNEAGETWHYFDQVVGLPVTMIDLERLGSVNLHDYTHIIMVDGRYNGISEAQAKAIHAWVKAGGTIIGQKGGAQWLSQQGILAAKFSKRDDVLDGFDSSKLSYGEREQALAQQRIAGAAFSADLDASHPLTFGLDARHISLFRNSNLIMQVPETPFITVARYKDKPLASGYAADQLVAKVANSAAVVAHRHGQGHVIGFTDPMNFRGYWRGTRRMLSNAVYLSPLIDAAD